MEGDGVGPERRHRTARRPRRDRGHQPVPLRSALRCACAPRYVLRRGGRRDARCVGVRGDRRQTAPRAVERRRGARAVRRGRRRRVRRRDEADLQDRAQPELEQPRRHRPAAGEMCRDCSEIPWPRGRYPCPCRRSSPARRPSCISPTPPNCTRHPARNPPRRRRSGSAAACGCRATWQTGSRGGARRRRCAG